MTVDVASEPDAIARATDYVLRLFDPESGGFVFAAGNEPTLMGTAYAVHALEFLGGLDRLTTGQKQGITGFLMRCRGPDGSFRDPLFDPSEIATGSHDAAYFEGEMTCFAQNALDALDAPPPPARSFPERLLSADGLRAEFDSYDWRDPHLNSNRVMFWMAQLAHEVERHGRDELLPLMDVGLDWMDENQSPRTGLWSGPEPVSLSAAMAATFHYTFFYSYRSRRLRHPERIIDSCLELQRDDGLFARNHDVGQTCLDYDALDLLAKASLATDYRQPDVSAAFAGAAAALAGLANPDGGFANVKERRQGTRRVPAHGPYHTGLRICSCDNTESNAFSTWFRLLAMALCAQPAWIERRTALPVRFRRMPWLGYHDVEAIRTSYRGVLDRPEPIAFVPEGGDGAWRAQLSAAPIGPAGNRYLLRLPERLSHMLLKVRLICDGPTDIRASYRTAGQLHFVGARSLKQSAPEGENIAVFVMGDDSIDRDLLLEVSAEAGGGEISEVLASPLASPIA